MELDDPDLALDPLYEGVRWFDEGGLPITYPAWNADNSRVVSGPYGPDHESKFRGRRFSSRGAARVFWARRATILEEHRVPGRWIFRVRKQ